METGVIIARFQTPYLHEGHIDLIEKVKENHNKLIIVLGISPVPGRKNPYDYYTREKMIKKEYNNVIILPLSDHPCDAVWSENLDNLLSGVFPTEQFKLYGSRDSFITYYSGKFETIELPEHGDYSATELRRQYEDQIFDSKDFRAGILYAYHNQYKKVYPTMDVAVFRSEKQEILLGRKANSTKWRLVGGFADPEDENYEAAARRELLEECGQIEVGDMTYETSMKIDDWRYRSEADKIITLLFSCDLQYGTPEAHDDIAEVKWFMLDNIENLIANGQFSDEHTELIRFLTHKYAVVLN